MAFAGPARAADDCLSEPNGPTSQGKHWYYRIERGTGRHCWYLRGEDEPARATAPDPTAIAKASSRNAEPSRNAEMLAPRSIADARAEWPTRPEVTAATPRTAAGVAGGVPQVATAQAPSAGPWPDPSRAMPSLGAPPETTAAASDQPTDATAAPIPVPPPPAALAMPADRNTGSLQKLLLVAFGALALAGLTGSAVYRLADSRRRARIRRDRWPTRKPQQIAGDITMQPWAPPELENTALSRDLLHESADIDDVDADGFDEPVMRRDRRPAKRSQYDDAATQPWAPPEYEDTTPSRRLAHESADIDDVHADDLDERVMRGDHWPASNSHHITDDATTQPRAPQQIEETTPLHDLADESDDVDDIDAAGPQVERIEDFLARLTRQIEAEMGAQRPERRREQRAAG